MKSVLKKLESWLRVHHPDLRADLRRGLMGRKVDELSEETGADVNEELKELLRWHNGQKYGSVDFSPEGSLLGEFGITEQWSQWMELEYNGRFPSADWFHPSWLPIVGRDEVFLCVDVFGSNGGIPGQIVEFRPGHPKRIIRHGSLTEWLCTTLAAFESGIYEVGAAGNVFVSPGRENELMEMIGEFSPGYPIQIDAGQKEKPPFHRLLDAIRERDLAAMIKVLTSEEVDVNRTAPDGRPPLVKVALADAPDLVAPLLEHGAEVDWEDWTDGRRALHWAAEYGPTVLPLLIEAGADVSAPLQYSALTPLMLAAWKGHPSSVKALLAAGTDPTRKSSLGETALSKSEDEEVIAILEEALATHAASAE